MRSSNWLYINFVIGIGWEGCESWFLFGHDISKLVVHWLLLYIVPGEWVVSRVFCLVMRFPRRCVCGWISKEFQDWFVIRLNNFDNKSRCVILTVHWTSEVYALLGQSCCSHQCYRYASVCIWWRVKVDLAFCPTCATVEALLPQGPVSWLCMGADGCSL